VGEPVETVTIDIDRLRAEAKDHILYMLGAPVTKLELDDLQVKHALDYAVELIDYAGFGDEEEYSVLLKEGGLAYAKYMLGRVRVKFASQPESPADGFALVNEANRDIDAFRIRLGLE
jgi:hypothetical protein